MLKIGSVDLMNTLVLGPMAGVTDAPFRKIVREFTSGLVCGEMTSGMALHYNSKVTRNLLKFDPVERPISFQIFGSDPRIMAEAALTVEAMGPDIIDINMGCPVPKVVKNGEGAALLNDLPLAGAIIAAVVNEVKTPVTVKCRLGWDREHIVAPQLAKIAEECGAAAIAVHARTRDQFYLGKADWDAIASVKQSVTIPVIGNGDVDSPQAAVEIIRQTGCDGVMIGRGCLGKPWIFKQINLFLDHGFDLSDPSFSEKLAIMFRHLELQIDHSGEEHGIKEMRKHLAWYLKGMPGATKIKEKINHLTSFDAVKEVLLEYAAGFDHQKISFFR